MGLGVDPLVVIETATGQGIGTTPPVVGYTVNWQNRDYTITTVAVGSGIVMTPSVGSIPVVALIAGQTPGIFPKVLKANILSIRGNAWASAASGDRQYDTSYSYPAQTNYKIPSYIDGTGSSNHAS
jgi:hypothetical protein